MFPSNQDLELRELKNKLKQSQLNPNSKPDDIINLKEEIKNRKNKINNIKQTLF